MASLLLADRIRKAREGFINDYRYLEGMLKQAVKRA